MNLLSKIEENLNKNISGVRRKNPRRWDQIFFWKPFMSKP